MKVPPVALIATVGSLALVTAIVFAMWKSKEPDDDSVREIVRNEPSYTPAAETRYKYLGNSVRSPSDEETVTVGGKRKSKRKRKSNRKYSKKA